jgi:hypothetical protein
MHRRCQTGLQKGHEVSARKLAGRHGEFIVLDPAPPDNAAHANIVRRVKERHRCDGAPHQASQIIILARVPAEQAMVTELPQVPGPAHRCRVDPGRIDGVIRVGCFLLEIDGQLVDLNRTKPVRKCRATTQQLGKFRQLGCRDLRSQPALGDAVVGKGQRPPFRFDSPVP